MIPKISVCVVIVAWVNYASGASFSKVFVQNNAEALPVDYEYLQYNPATTYGGAHLARLAAAPYNTYPEYSAGFLPFYSGQAVASVPSANLVSYNTHPANLPLVLAPTDPTGYEYSYAIFNQGTGDHKTQRELRDGSLVHGEYAFLQPDGYVREVKYVADENIGLKAFVKNFMPAHIEEVKTHHAAVESHGHGYVEPPCDDNVPAHYEIVQHEVVHHEPAHHEAAHHEAAHHEAPHHESAHHDHEALKEEPELEHEEHHVGKSAHVAEHEPEHHEHEPEHHEGQHEEHHEVHHEPEHSEHHEPAHEEHESHHDTTEHHESHEHPEPESRHHESPEHELEEPEHHGVHAFERLELVPENHEVVHPPFMPTHNVLVPYQDVIRCIEAAMRGSQGVPVHRAQPPLTYIVLNKPC